MEIEHKGQGMLKVKLVVVGGVTERDEFQPTLPAVLGRSRNVEVPLPHPLISRRHCELVEKNQQLFVRDLGSTNGTFVGSERVEVETIVEHGALLTIGTVTFRAFYDERTQLDPPSHYGTVAKDSAKDVATGSAAAKSGLPVHQDPDVSVGKIDTSTITRIDTGTLGSGRKENRKSQKAGQ